MSRSRVVTLPELEELAIETWAGLRRGAVVWLTGELGAGKTTFVRFLSVAAGAESARSPTYGLVHQYGLPGGPLVHVDCFRLRVPDEAVDLDFPALQQVARALLIEWPENAGDHAPPPDLHLHFAHTGAEDERLVEGVE